jgi:hypothetical protein
VTTISQFHRESAVACLPRTPRVLSESSPAVLTALGLRVRIAGSMATFLMLAMLGISSHALNKWTMSKLQIRSIVMSGVKLLSFRLEINSYRKRLFAYQKIQNPATRAAVTARAIEHALPSMYASVPNEDIISSYLTEALTRNDESSFT